MQVEINGEEKAVQASDIKVGDVITWGQQSDYHMCTSDTNIGIMYFTCLSGVSCGNHHHMSAELINSFSHISIVTDKCKLVVTKCTNLF